MPWRRLAAVVVVLAIAAGAVFARWHALHRINVPVLMRQARSAAARGDFSSAKRICRDVLQSDPNHSDALLLQAQLAVLDGDRESALLSLRQIGNTPASIGARARYGEGCVLLELGRAREAEAMLLKALELEPQAFDVEKKLRDLYMIQLRREDFRSLMRARRSMHPWALTDLLDFLVAGHISKFQLQDWAQAVKAYTEHDSEDIPSRLALAAYYAAASQYSESEETARTVIRADSTNRRARALAADALLGQDKPDEARAVLDQIAPGSPADAWVERSLGRLELAGGNVEVASEHLQHCLQQDPGDPTALYLLGLAQERLGEASQANDRASSAYRMHNLLDVAQSILKKAADAKDSHVILEQVRELGELMFACELYEDATYCFELLLREDPRNSKTRELYAKARNEADRRSAPGASVAPARVAPSRATSVVKRTEVPSARRGAGGSTMLSFDDVASRVGIAFEYFSGNTGKKYLFETLGGGVAAFDFDGDGWPDLYFSQGSHFPHDPSDFSYRDQLYRNMGGQEFATVTEAAGLGDHEYTIGCTAGDYNNDGFVDLFISNYGRLRTYRNNGDGSFSEVSESAGISSAGMNTSLALADFNRDGDLDLYVVRYLTDIRVCTDENGKIFVCHPSAFEGEQDLLFENLGNGQFRDVTAVCGIKVPEGKGLGIVVADLDNDEWPDIYVANDTTANFLFRNLSGQQSESPRSSLRFEERGLPSGAALSRDGRAQAGMGIACADFDDNSCLDLYVTNYYLETNSVYLNQGNLVFVESPKPTCLVADTGPLLGFGTQPIDVDLDGYLDLFVTNGHIDDYREQDPQVMWKMPPKLYQNHGEMRFSDVSATAGRFFSGNYLGRGVARLDWNRDTRPDLVVCHQGEPVALLENTTRTTARRIVVDCVGTMSNRDAVNTRLSVRANGHTRLVEVSGGDGYLACNERRQIIGMGEADRLDSLEVTWPSGRRDRWQDIPTNVLIRLVEGRNPIVEPVSLHP